MTKVARLAGPVQEAESRVDTNCWPARLVTKRYLTTFVDSEVSYTSTLHWFTHCAV